MNTSLPGVLILADIEGSSGCWNRQSAAFMTRPWAQACHGMTLDVAVVVDALLAAGVDRIVVKDFHRTGYNLLPERINPKAKVISGYRSGPVPGIGRPQGLQVLFLLGMHAASGSGGFLAHTLTSRIASLTVNGARLAEVELFAASLAPYGLRPIFFSGCPIACRQAALALPGIATYAIDKRSNPQHFDACAWRQGLAAAARAALHNSTTRPHLPMGPFCAQVVFRDGSWYAHRIARRWRLPCRGTAITVKAATFNDLYRQLIRVCYLTPLIDRTLPLSLLPFNLMGRLGLTWVRYCLRRQDVD